MKTNKTFEDALNGLNKVQTPLAEDSAEEDHMGDESDDADSEEMCQDQEQATNLMLWHL